MDTARRLRSANRLKKQLVVTLGTSIKSVIRPKNPDKHSVPDYPDYPDYPHSITSMRRQNSSGGASPR